MLKSIGQSAEERASPQTACLLEPLRPIGAGRFVVCNQQGLFIERDVCGIRRHGGFNYRVTNLLSLLLANTMGMGGAIL